MHRPFLVAGCLLSLFAVAAGAFGAHGLEGSLSADRLATFETAARYQMYHALGLLALGLLAARWPTRAWAGPGLLMLLGVLIFSGSLYALALSGVGVFGAIAPIGGTGLIASWGWTALVAMRAT